MLPELFLLLTSNNHQLIQSIVAGLLTISAFFLKISKWMEEKKINSGRIVCKSSKENSRQKTERHDSDG